jgi:TRAP-type C4-dicarboxylate transport system permease small subunit
MNPFKILAKNQTPGTADNQLGVDTVGDGKDTLVSNITNILNGIIAVLGLVCVVVIIIGGVNYMTSSGDAGKVKKAKDTILYGLIGLIVCVLAFALVNFVISNIIA